MSTKSIPLTQLHIRSPGPSTLKSTADVTLSFLLEDTGVVQSLSHVGLFATPWTAARQASLSFTIPRSLLKFMSIELVMISNHVILCHPLLLLYSVNLHIKWPKYWSFSISPSKEYSGLISFRIDWFDLPAVHGTVKSPL